MGKFCKNISTSAVMKVERIAFGKKNWLKIGFLGVAFWLLNSQQPLSAQDWRVSGGYNMQVVGYDYVSNNSYTGEIRPGSKGMMELEVERYLLYRLYIAGKGELLYHNDESVFLGGPVNFNQVNLGAVVGIQGDKLGIYGGIKAGRLWNIKLMGVDANNNTHWLPPRESAGRYTTSFTGGIKYYLTSFLRMQVEVSQSFNLPASIVPQESSGIVPVFETFDFNPVSLSVGVSISIPWHSKSRLDRIEENGSVPLLSTGPVSFSSPLAKPAVITSKYGKRWKNMHKGIDIDAERGDDILAAADGVVVKAGVGTGYGKMVKIQHSGGYSTIYAHLRKIKVKAGQKVKKGDVIGKAGNTGTSSGIHLHFEILQNEAHLDPQSYIRF